MSFKPSAPNFQGGSISVWNSIDKNGKAYLKVKIFGFVTNCFAVVPNGKEKEVKK